MRDQATGTASPGLQHCSCRVNSMQVERAHKAAEAASRSTVCKTRLCKHRRVEQRVQGGRQSRSWDAWRRHAMWVYAQDGVEAQVVAWACAILVMVFNAGRCRESSGAGRVPHARS